VLTIISAQYRQGAEVGHARFLFDFSCSLKDGSCEGVEVDLRNLETRRLFRNGDTHQMSEARLVSRVGNVFVVLWGNDQLTIDLPLRKASFRESRAGFFGGDQVDWIGEGICRPFP